MDLGPGPGPASWQGWGPSLSPDSGLGPSWSSGRGRLRSELGVGLALGLQELGWLKPAVRLFGLLVTSPHGMSRLTVSHLPL